MVRRVRRVYQCPDCMSVSEARHLTELGGKVRPYFRDRDGRPSPGVVIHDVLCWWCRERHSPDEVEACMAMKRPEVSNGQLSGSSSGAKREGLLAGLPLLWEFLVATSYEDGKPRRPGRMSCSCVSNGIQISLTEITSDCYLTRTAETLEDALLAVEEALGSSGEVWRKSNYNQSKRK